jgi:hypothetical protein
MTVPPAQQVVNEWSPGDSAYGSSVTTTAPPSKRLQVSPSTRAATMSESSVTVNPPPVRLPSSGIPKRFPPMPQIGLSDRDYSHLTKEAERRNDPHAKEAAKVGMYITSALNPDLPWEEKLRFLEHALHRHCNPPPYPDEETWLFYKELSALVKRYAGQEALRLASREDDFYAARLSMGQNRDKIEDEAEVFFGRLIGNGMDCPEFLTEDDFHMVKMIRDQWI